MLEAWGDRAPRLRARSPVLPEIWALVPAERRELPKFATHPVRHGGMATAVVGDLTAAVVGDLTAAVRP
jgi:hypothetical protein